MILHRLIGRFLRHRDDPEFYRLQAVDAIRWMRQQGVTFGSGVRVLDLGCGHGVFGGELRKAGCEVTFADAASYLLPEHAQCPFIQVDLDAEEWPEMGQYDVVICSNVLEHLSRPEGFLRRADGLLAPGGRFYLSWTNWLSPWGGHEFSPWHYLGPRLGPWIFDLYGKSRLHVPGKNLFYTSIGSVLKVMRTMTGLRVLRRAPRYYTELSFLMWIPLVREFVAWNAALLLGKKGE